MVADLTDTTNIYTCSLTLQDLSKILLVYPKIPRSCLQDVSLGDATASIPTNQLSNLINYARRKSNLEIFSVYDFNQWCINHKYNENSLHSTFVPYYYINDINGLFVLFTTKQLLNDTQFSNLLKSMQRTN